MHIEPGLVAESKIWLGYVTASGVAAYGLMLARKEIRANGLIPLASRSLIATALVFCFFEILPHFPVGVSEVHLILGSTLFLLLGASPAAIGLALGLLMQGVLVAPSDLPQYGMNITTLLVPLFALMPLARKIIADDKPYVALRYSQAFALSTTYQAGIVGWVTFWALYGQGFSVANLTSIASFGGAYMTVILVEPLVDLAVLALAKAGRDLGSRNILNRRVFEAA